MNRYTTHPRYNLNETFASLISTPPCAQLLMRVHTAFFVAGSVVASHRDVADSLLVLVAGRVGVYLPGRSRRIYTLEPG